MRRAFRAIALVLSGVMTTSLAPHARADDAPAPIEDANVAARRGLIEQAQAAREAGDHARALDLARRAGQIGMSPSLRRFIAEEEEALSMPAEALGTAELCVREGAGDPAQEQHVEACRGIVERAKAAVGHIVIRLEPAPEGAHVRVRGVDVPRAVWGAPYVVSPGVVDVEAGAPGYVDRSTKVEVERGAVVEVPITLERAPSESEQPAARAEKRPAPFPFRRVARRPATSSSPSPLVPIGAAVAMVGTGLAIGMGVAGQARLDDYESRCTVPGAPSSCIDEHRDLSSDLDTSALLVNLAIGAAVAGAVTAVVGLVLGNRTPSKSARAPGFVLEL